MTSKSATARKARQPSPAELKRQAAASKNEASQALLAVAELTGIVKGLAQDIQSLKSVPTKEQVLARHDQNHRMVNQVLGESDVHETLPEKPEVHMPDHLLRAEREMNRQHDARNNPVAIRQGVETDERDIGQYEPRTMNSEGPASESLSPLRLVDEGIVVDGKRWTPEKMAIEKFMQELVCVQVADSTDETQIPLPLSINNGKTQYFVRGELQWVKRMYLEPLARSKTTRFTQKLITHDNGVQAYIYLPHTMLTYPFTVIEDTQKGKDWLRRILAEK